MITYNGSILKVGSSILGNSAPPMPPIADRCIRFRFSDPTYDPTQYSWGSYSNTWTRVTEMSGNVWDHYNPNNKYKDKFTDPNNLVEILGTNHYFGTASGAGYFDGWFAGNTSLISADFSGETRKSNVSSFFSGCSRLQEVWFPDMVGFDSTFRFCSALRAVHFTEPTVSCTTFGRTFDECSNLVQIDNMVTSSATSLSATFNQCILLETAPAIDCTSCTDASAIFFNCSKLMSPVLTNTSRISTFNHAFGHCTSLVAAPDISMSGATTCRGMFSGCTSLETARAYDSASVVDFYDMFAGCGKLKQVPLLRTDSATTVDRMFVYTNKVESGALALYQQMSTQANPPSSHSWTFEYCGSDTTTGAAELAQIPSSWGGTAV